MSVLSSLDRAVSGNCEISQSAPLLDLLRMVLVFLELVSCSEMHVLPDSWGAKDMVLEAENCPGLNTVVTPMVASFSGESVCCREVFSTIW